MRKLSFLLSILILFVSTNSFAAGSWASCGTESLIEQGFLAQEKTSLYVICREFTSDAADASVPTWPATIAGSPDKEIGGLGGLIVAYEYVEDGTVPPTSAIITLKTKNGNAIGDGDFPSATMTDSDYVPLSSPQQIIGGLHASFTAVGNSKKGRFYIYVLK